jgi:hypothetical protein
LPVAVIAGPGGVLYGITASGGISNRGCVYGTCGTVFELSPPAAPVRRWTLTTLHQFTGQNGDGSGPHGIV